VSTLKDAKRSIDDMIQSEPILSAIY
jgi:hypothetical protein